MPETVVRGYIGDGLYAEFTEPNAWYLRLYTLDNEGVFLEDDVFKKMLDFVKLHRPDWLKENK